MLKVLRNRTYRRLFSAQIVALVGTGMLTVALALLAFDLAGGDAGIVLGIALTIKMLAYVGIAPVISALTAHVPRKTLLVSADVLRAIVALSLPFVTEAWQIYVLIFLLQAASATFTPAFQALIPAVLPNESDYTRARSTASAASASTRLASLLKLCLRKVCIGANRSRLVGSAPWTPTRSAQSPLPYVAEDYSSAPLSSSLRSSRSQACLG